MPLYISSQPADLQAEEQGIKPFDLQFKPRPPPASVSRDGGIAIGLGIGLRFAPATPEQKLESFSVSALSVRQFESV